MEAGSVAGSLRARVEQVYALSRDFRSAECPAAARGIAESLQPGNTAGPMRSFTRAFYMFHTHGDLGNAEGMLNDALENIKRADIRHSPARAWARSRPASHPDGMRKHPSRIGKVYGLLGRHVSPQSGLPVLRELSLLAEREKLWEFGYLVSRTPYLDRTDRTSQHPRMARFRSDVRRMTDRIEAMQFGKQTGE